MASTKPNESLKLGIGICQKNLICYVIFHQKVEKNSVQMLYLIFQMEN